MNKYAAPALVKGLEIIELLAHRESPMTHAEIAKALGRSKSELFRMLVTLQERGYLHRDTETDTFTITDRLFRLGLRVPHVRTLIDYALPRLNRLALEIEQSAHLVVMRHGKTAVIAGSSGGSDMSFSLKLGFGRIAADSTSGQVIMAFQSEQRRLPMMRESLALQTEPLEEAVLSRELERIREQGYELHDSRDFSGISDICCPIFDDTDNAVASVVIAFVERFRSNSSKAEALAALQECCAAISRELGAAL
ncbi:IclR family transcriptional regulator [Pararhizobium mangrovi]|uniref:IclR family transcriptional regulator n=1 Tax=Pararhizobium mangrovi TaxID=2590452 RepID=A0A506U3D2_9HYPH|nr:IclR family transcriptional regulator [Pararhizobium mangrovi]TPW27544.1 IclR family transcriptional regulator [Pararhizobium mangrovi]